MEKLSMSLTCSTITMSVAVSVAMSKTEVILHQTWGENQQRVFLGYLIISTNIKCYEACHLWQFYHLARWSTDAYCI